MSRPVKIHASGAEVVRKIIKARQGQIARLENEIRQLQEMVDQAEARQVKVPGT